MHDLSAKLERLLREAEECELIGRLATDLGKRELFTRLATDLRGMTRDMEAVIAEHRSRSRFPFGITRAASSTFARWRLLPKFAPRVVSVPEETARPGDPCKNL